MGVRGLLPRYDATNTPLRELVPLLEAAMYSKQAVLAMAATVSGATAASIMAELIKQTQTLRGAGSATSAAGASSLAGQSAPSGHSDAYEEALTGEAFIKFKAALASADLLSTAGRHYRRVETLLTPSETAHTSLAQPCPALSHYMYRSYELCTNPAHLCRLR
ncbi:hypothetical protein AB1Y20_016981 [Prymnesium parvum]|uniref:Uncharacterized protein n=1 Tax=Prymnesium parvum TaxID=97485 RepID=A0AB34IAU2_PRYPA